jgi:GNAT superfamily N-acetyltransferase
MMIRLASLDDAEAIAKVHATSWMETYRGLIPQNYLANLSTADRLAMWTSAIENRQSIWVAEHEQRIIGFATGGKNRSPNSRYPGELYALYLVAEFHRRGVGLLLLDKVRSELRNLQLSPFVIWVMKDNPALHFYTRMGAQLIGEQDLNFDGLTVREVELLCE